MKRTANNLIAIARKEIGYCEKASNSSLDDKTANAGHNNYQKYGRDLANAGYYNGNKNGFEWCDQFVDWCFWTLCDHNRTEAEKMECQQDGLCGAGVPYSAQYYKNHGRLDSHPRVGDQAFFGHHDHTGIVSAVNGNQVTVIEGNKHDCVSENTYTIGNWLSNEFGHPFYEVDNSTPVPTPKPTAYTQKDFITDVQRTCGANIDGIAGPNTLAHTVTVSGNYIKHPVVVPLQKWLYAQGYTEVGPADGCTGPNYTAAVKHYQRDHGTGADGIVTAGQITWKN